jgi:putative transposase
MRRPRELRAGVRYHVTARANRKEMILDANAMKELFLSVVKRAKEMYDFRLENLCVMGNHFHFIIQPEHGESLSAIMQWIMSVFAMTYNRIKGISGHVWGCRFFSRIIENLRALMQAHEYIDDNPVKASQIEDKRQWRWGGLWFHRTGNADIVESPSNWVMLQFPEHGLLLLPDLKGR